MERIEGEKRRRGQEQERADIGGFHDEGRAQEDAGAGEDEGEDECLPPRPPPYT